MTSEFGDSETRGNNVMLVPGPVCGSKRENCVESVSLCQGFRFADVQKSILSDIETSGSSFYSGSLSVFFLLSGLLEFHRVLPLYSDLLCTEFLQFLVFMHNLEQAC